MVPRAHHFGFIIGKSFNRFQGQKFIPPERKHIIKRIWYGSLSCFAGSVDSRQGPKHKPAPFTPLQRVFFPYNNAFSSPAWKSSIFSVIGSNPGYG